MQSTDWIQKYKTCLYGKSTIDIPLDLASLISRFWDLSMYLACSSTLNLKHKTRISLCASYSGIYFFKKPLTTNTMFNEVKQKECSELFLTWSFHSSASVRTLPPSFWLPVLYDGGQSLCLSLSVHSVFFLYNVG